MLTWLKTKPFSNPNGKVLISGMSKHFSSAENVKKSFWHLLCFDLSKLNFFVSPSSVPYKRKPHISFVLVWGKTQTRNIWGIYHEGTFFSFTFLFIRKLRLKQNTRFSNTCRGLALSWALQHRAGHKAASVTLGGCESFLGTLPPWAHDAEVNNSAPTLYVPAAALQIPYIPSFQSFPCCYLLWHPVWFILCTSSMKSNKCPISYFHLSIFIIFMSEVSEREIQVWVSSQTFLFTGKTWTNHLAQLSHSAWS